MELQIQDLVSSIKKEGIDAARTEAENILAEAEKKAASIVAAAKAEAESMLAKAARETEALREGARTSAAQAQRDAALSFKNEVKGEFEKILTAGVGRTVQGSTLASLIRAALNGEDPAMYAAEVSEVTEALRSELAEEVKNGLEIRPAKSVRSGFKLAMKDGSGYFDCTDDEIAAMLKPFFSELGI